MNPEIWRYIFDAIEDPAFLHDAEFRVLLVNRAYCREAGVTEAQALGKPYWEVFPPGTGPLPGCKDAVIGKSHAGSEEEVSVGAKLFLSKSYVVRDDKGNLLHALHLLSDISAGKGAAENLKKSEARYRSYIEVTGQLAWVTDPDGMVVEDIPTWRAFSGLSEEQVKGWGWTDALHPDDREHAAQIWREAVARKGVYEVEYRVLRRDGIYRDFFARGMPVLDELGGVIEWVGTSIDITERKQAEGALRKSKDFLQSVVENVPARIFWKDRDSRYLGCNSLFAKDAGLSRPDELISKTDFEMGWKDQAELYRAGDKATMESGTSKLDYEEPQTTPDGKTIWLRTSKVPLRNESKQVIGILGLYQDITDRKQAEQALREREEMLGKVAASAQDAILMLDNDGNIAFWNAAAEKTFGYSSEEALGKNLHLLLAPARFHEAHRTGFDRFRSTGEGAAIGKTLELAALRKDGTEFPMELSLSAVKLKDKWHAVGILRDITERKKSEEGLKLFRALIDQSNDAIEVLDAETLRFLDVSQKTCLDLGYSREELLSLSAFDIDSMMDRSRTAEMLQEILKLGSMIIEGRHRRKDGSDFPVEVSLRFVQLDRAYIISVARDITKRKQDERTLERSNRALRTLSACNGVLVRAGNEVELLDSICRLIVETGGYRMAWVGFPEPDAAKTVRPVAQYGHDEEYLEAVNISWADSQRGHGPTGTAMRTGTVQVNQNFLTNPALTLWREVALPRGYHSSIALPLKSAAGTLGVLTIYASEPDAFNEAEVTLLQELADDLAFGIETLRTRAERDRIAYEQLHHVEILRQSLEDSIKAIADTVEMRDPYTAGHQRRVAQLAIAIAREMGLPEETSRGIALAASIHDLGKISVPAEILAKPSKLTAIELMLLKTHAQAGFDILKDIKFPWPIATMVLQHHERLDGSGYPQGLKGDQILLESRIMAVADVVEAMASHRPYRPALGIDSALQEIKQGRGTVYDPTVVDACTQLFSEKRFAFSS